MNIFRVLVAISILFGLFLLFTAFEFSPYLLVGCIIIGQPMYKLFKKIIYVAAKLIDSAINNVL